MVHKKLTYALSVVLILALSACNLPVEEATPTPDLPMTLTAQHQALNSPTPGDTATPVFTSTPEFTPTPSVPQVTVSVNTNCRTGPGTQYDLVGALLVGQVGIVVGKNTATGYWIINNPGQSGTCWLWGQHATVSGNTAGLTEYAIPATPTPALPAAVANLKGEITCVLQNNPVFYNEVKVKLTWEDKASNEKGINIYRDGSLLISLAPNSTSYEDNTTLPAIWIIGDPPPSLTYTVRTFNDAGESPKSEVNVKCP
jgi:uncharacterized protein YgiM (DUF1202 family)